ncbi:MAG: M3 family oligoendopeptidase [Chloroflexi bacterium]|nr:M3 family oligoendopeptidase [Chloroflexota bacterium]
MLKNLPTTPQEIIAWTWPAIEPYYKDLAARPLSAANVDGWLADWSSVGERIEEMYARLSVTTSVNTADKEADARMNAFLDGIFPNVMAAEQKLKEKLLASKLEPKGFDIPLRNMRAEADLFRESNLALLADQQKLAIEYDKIYGAQTVKWEGEEITLTRLAMNFQQPDRARREKAWHLKAERQLSDRKAINDLWQKFMDVRARIAKNADKPSYREYTWMQKLRFDYGPEDCKSFAAAIEQVVVPAATHIYQKRKQALGLDSLRPWDLVDGWYSRPTPRAPSPVLEPGLTRGNRDYHAGTGTTTSRAGTGTTTPRAGTGTTTPRAGTGTTTPAAGNPQLKPFASIEELKSKTSAIFHQVDPVLGGYFDSMVAEGLTDLDNRKNKAPGAYCTSYTSIRKPFIFVNAVGTHDDVMTTLHESGHSFHVFETAKIPYIHQLAVPMEFAEVASMGMELLASPYLTKANGGFYSDAEAAVARIEHLEGMLLFWPFMAAVDSFQQWVYENQKEGADPAACDKKWGELWDRFIPGVDYSGLEEVKVTGWHRKLHIHQVPFYYVEYGLAQLGVVQIFGNARTDQASAVAAYRKALSLGGMVTLPELFATARAKFAFDAPTVKKAVDLMEGVVRELESKL